MTDKFEQKLINTQNDKRECKVKVVQNVCNYY